MTLPKLPLCIALACAMAIAVSTACWAAPNIYPDPGFEKTGVAGNARSGEKSGYFKVDAMNHWAALGGSIKVEPFARYRVTEWVKGKIGKGNFYGPYCYDWDNYVWAFASSVTIKTSEEWVKTELTFVSPNATMSVHPLAYIDCENSEAWVDDIVVEKIAEPEAVMAEYEAVASPSADQARILARWYVSRGEMDKAVALMKKQGGIVRSDIACLIALNTEDIAARRPFIVEMVAYGGPTYNYGDRRFNEITEGMSMADKLAVREDAVTANPTSALAAKAFRSAVEGYVSSDGDLLTVTEQQDELKGLQATIGKLLGVVPADSPANGELRLAMQSADEASRKLEQAAAQLGTCIVNIGGKPVSPDTHVIVIPDEATAQEEHAAKDLRYHLALITGKALTVVRDAELGARTPIVIGKSGVIGKLGQSIDFEGLGIEGIHIKTAGPALILAGNRRGVLYATYTFLEDYLGCRWFAPDCSKHPMAGDISVPEIDRRYLPPLEYRATDYPSSRPADFAVRNKYNGTIHSLDEPRGGKISYRGFVHTFNALVPPETYFAEHPEYYSEINGNRLGPDRTQLCLTNPDVLKIATQTVRQWIAQSPDATIISVSQNDWHNYCQCDKCTALAEEEGSQSGPLLHFVNAIADDIAKDYPDKIIDTLAYQYTRKPPKHVKPSPNVAVRLCSIECCFIHPLEDDPYNSTFVDDIKGWNEICDRLHIWDYVINYAHSIMPFPNLYVLKPNIQFFIDHGVTGIYEEACYYTKGSEMQELRSYVMAKLLWDPSYDADKAIDEFCEGYWGPAGKYVREFINVVQESAQSIPDMHVRIYSPPSVGYLTPEVIAKSVALFDQAEEAVKDDARLLHRVQVARLPIMYTQIALGISSSYAEKDGKLVQDGAAADGDIVQRFETIARREGVTRVREGGAQNTLDAWLESLPKRSDATKILSIGNANLQLMLLPEMGGRIWRMKLLPENRELVKTYGHPNAWQPDEGGYEEYSESGYRAPGWSEPYTVVEQSDSHVILTGKFNNGLQIVREVRLDAAKPIVKVTSTLSNTTNADKPAALRIHPEFAVSSTEDAVVRTYHRPRQCKQIALANPADPQAEKDSWLPVKDIAGGKWEIEDKGAKLVITNTVKPEQIDRVLLNRSGSKSRVNLELFGPQKMLAPGESMTIEHSYEITRTNG